MASEQLRGSWICREVIDDIGIDYCICLTGYGFRHKKVGELDDEINELTMEKCQLERENEKLKKENAILLNEANIEKKKLVIEEKRLDVKSEHPYCSARVRSGTFMDGSPSYAMHYCMLREKYFEDMGATSYCCMIDKENATIPDTPCRYRELFNTGKKLVINTLNNFSEWDNC